MTHGECRHYAATDSPGPASIAMQGSIRIRPILGRDERQRSLQQLGEILSLRPDDVYSRALRAALYQDAGDHGAASEDISVLAASVGLLHVAVAFALGAFLMVATRCIRLEEFYKAIEWPIIILIGGMIPLGTAMVNTGTATWVATSLKQTS